MADGHGPTLGGGSGIPPKTPATSGGAWVEVFNTSRPPSKAEFLKLKFSAIFIRLESLWSQIDTWNPLTSWTLVMASLYLAWRNRIIP